MTPPLAYRVSGRPHHLWGSEAPEFARSLGQSAIEVHKAIAAGAADAEEEIRVDSRVQDQ